jgi:hypothetical protein
MCHLGFGEYEDPNAHDFEDPFLYHVAHARVLTLCSIGLLVPKICNHKFSNLQCSASADEMRNSTNDYFFLSISCFVNSKPTTTWHTQTCRT